MYPREQSSEQSNYAAGQGKARLVSPRVFCDNLKWQRKIPQTRTPETLYNHRQEGQDDIQSDGEDSRGRIQTQSGRPQTYYNEDLRRTIEPSDKVEYALPERKIELKVESLPKRRYRRHRYRCRIIDGGSN